jgi:spore coat polysaccharide biosynthesis protein SpsF
VSEPDLVAVIQARTSSSRLPGKVLRPLGGRPVLAQVVDRVAAFADVVVVATSEGADDDPVADLAEELGTVCVRGPLDDVFARFRLALEDPRVPATEWFARVTADCPLVSPTLARHLLAHRDTDADVVAVRNEDVTRGLPVELVRRSSFAALDPAALDGPQREHVTLVFYERPERHRVRFVEVPAPFDHPELRLTLDYPEDAALLEALFTGRPDLRAEEAIEAVLADPALAAVNRSQQQKDPRAAS